MYDPSGVERAIELLQELGLKEYEAKCFVALSRLPQGTAKEISDVSDVPRTRVYDAIRVLETMGLVEIQHSNPQKFRAVSVDEAATTLRNVYENRTESLRTTLRGIDPIRAPEETEVTHEVWALAGDEAISNRTDQLIGDASEEIVLVIGHDRVFTERLSNGLADANEDGVDVVIGTHTDQFRARIQEVLPEIQVFVSELDWLGRSDLPGDDTEISRLLLVDRGTILVSSISDTRETDLATEHAVFGRGFDNGLVAIVRRLLASGLVMGDDPGIDDPVA